MKTQLLIIAALLSFAGLAATNDYARCWAVTQSGNRCKRRAVSNERYCHQHSAARETKGEQDRCRSMTTNGVQCTGKPMSNRSYCVMHMK